MKTIETMTELELAEFLDGLIEGMEEEIQKERDDMPQQEYIYAMLGVIAMKRGVKIIREHNDGS